MVLPQTMMSSVLTELNSFSSSDRAPDPFTTTRLRREISKLKNSDFIGSLLCEAILLTLEKNYEEVVKTYKSILEYVPNDADMHENFANSLSRLHRLNEAQSHYMSAIRIARSSEELLRELSNHVQITFGTEDLIEAVDIYIKATGNESIIEDPEVSGALALSKLLEWHDIESSEANRFYKAAEDVCIENGAHIQNGIFRHTGVYGGPTVTFYAGLVADSDFIADMNTAMCDKIVDHELTDLINKISFVFVPTEGFGEKGKEQAHAYHV